MEPRQENDHQEKKSRFQIDKLEERIAPGGHCAALAAVTAAGEAAGGLETATGAACCTPPQ